MKKLILGLLLFTQTALAGPPLTWGGSTTAQFFPTIVQALLGNGYSLVPSQAYFGDCSDGNVTISSGTTTLARDMFYNNLTINGTGVLSIQNQRVFVCGTLDLTAAPAGAIFATGNSGGNGGATGGAGAAGAATGAGTIFASQAGGAGGASSATTGAQGAVGKGGNIVSCVVGTSGSAGSSGAGGAGGGGAGGATRPQVVCTAAPMRDVTSWYIPANGAGTSYSPGGAGAGGGAGGGDGTTSGGGGGGGGGSGASIYLSAFNIATSGSSVAGTIVANGGKGGNGGSPSGTCTAGCGGGGGGGGGSGGWVIIRYQTKTGTAVTNLIQSLAGAGGTGGTHKNTGGVDGGNGNATAAQPGLIELLNLSTGVSTTSTSGNTSL
jgi:hypothetical protein